MTKKKTTKPGTKRTKGQRWKEVPTTALVPDNDAAGDPVQEVDEPEVTPDDEDIEEVLQQLPQDAKVEMWLWDAKLDDWGYLARYPAHGFTIDRMAREYGAGKYRMIIRGPVEGRMRIRGRKIFVIGGAPHDGAPAAGSTTSRVVETSLADLVRIQSDVMRANMNRPQESMADVMRMMAEVMKPPPPVERADPLKYALEIVALLKEGTGEKSNSFKEVRDILEMGMELGGSGGGDDGLNVFGKSLASLLERLEKKDVPKALPPAADPAATQPAETDAIRELKEFFQTANAVLARAAQRGADLDFYAEWVADNVPQSLDPYFAEWFNDTGYPDTLLGMFPEVAPDWLRPLLLKARALLTQEEEAEDIETRDGDDSKAGKVSTGDGDDVRQPPGGHGRESLPDAGGDADVRERDVTTGPDSEAGD